MPVHLGEGCLTPLYKSVAITKITDAHGHAGIVIVFLDEQGEMVDERVLRFNDGHRLAVDILALIGGEGVMA